MVMELHGAVKHGDTTLMKTLLDENRDLANPVSATDARGTYPLHVAAEFGQADAARLLLEYGADVSLLDVENEAIALCMDLCGNCSAVWSGLSRIRCAPAGARAFPGAMLQAAASPMMAAPASAALMGLDARLVLVTLVTGTALVPLTAPLFALVFLGPALSLSPPLLAAKLTAFLAGTALARGTLRRCVGLAAIARQKDRIDGLNVIVLFVFVAAVMEGVGARIVTAPMTTMALTALAFAVFFALLGLTILLFLPAGREHALALGFMVSQRNMGLMRAATGGTLPGLTWLYFVLSQFPISLPDCSNR